MLEEIKVVFYETEELLWELGDFLKEPKDLSPSQICMVDRHANCPLVSLERFQINQNPKNHLRIHHLCHNQQHLVFGKIGLHIMAI